MDTSQAFIRWLYASPSDKQAQAPALLRALIAGDSPRIDDANLTSFLVLRWPAGAELPIDLLELAVKAARSLQSAQGLGARVQALRIDNVLGRQRIDLPTALALMETGPREAFVSSEVTEKVRTQLQLLPCSFDFLALSERLAASDDTLDARAKEALAPLVSWVREQAVLRIPQAPTERSNPRP